MARKPRISTKESKTFADRLDELVKQKRENGITQKAICKATGLAEGAMSAWLNDEASPTLEAICKLSDYFGVSTDFLLGRTDIESKNVEFRAFCEYSGLSYSAANVFRKMKLVFPDQLHAINILFETPEFVLVLEKLSNYINKLIYWANFNIYDVDLSARGAIAKKMKTENLLAEYEASKEFAALLEHLHRGIKWEKEASDGCNQTPNN